MLQEASLTLDVRENEPENLSFLRKLPGLTSLTLNQRPPIAPGIGVLIDLESIGQLRGLTSLTLNLEDMVGTLKSLEMLTGLKSLTLDLTSSGVSELRPLEKLTGLTSLTLDLTNSRVSDLRPLQKLTALTSLRVDLTNGRAESDLAGLATTKLTHLSLLGANAAQRMSLRQLPSGLVDLALAPQLAYMMTRGNSVKFPLPESVVPEH